MTKYNTIWIIRLLTISLLATAGSFCVSYQYYWAGVIIYVAAAWCFVDVFHRTTRTVKGIKRLIEAIRFAELNISFIPAIKKGLPEELAQAMDNSLAQFRSRLIQTETDQMFYDTMLQRIDSGIMVVNGHGNIEWINKTAVDMLGKPQPHQLSDLENVLLELPTILEELVPREVKLLTISKNGVVTRVAATVSFFNSSGKDLKIISLKNIQSALEEHESDAWRKLIRVLTHEMMNSITPIISLSETLSEETAENNEKQYDIMSRAMQAIHRRSKGLVDFVKNYQQLTRIPEPVLANVPVKEMLVDINRLLKAENIDFSYRIHPDDIQLLADRAQIEQVLINLVKNAWEACRDMSQPKIYVEVYKNEYQKPVFAISDNGCGIIPDVMDKVFVPFFTTKTGGSGIGLSICRQIMNLHHGNISIESEIDKGTKVILRF